MSEDTAMAERNAVEFKRQIVQDYLIEKNATRHKEHKSPPTVPTEQGLRVDNVLEHNAPPKELQHLRSSNSFTFPDVPSDFNLDSVMHRVVLKNGMTAYNIDGKQRVFRGLPVQEFIRLKRTEIRATSPTLPLPPPHRPEWADEIYHPKMAPRITRPTMWRKNGKRVYPNFIWNNNDVRQP